MIDRENAIGNTVLKLEADLQSLTPEQEPLIYVRMQYDLGDAYWALAQIEDEERNLRRAIAAYEAVMRYRMPEDYILTEYNLGLAYRDLAQIESLKGNPRGAVAAYEAALKYQMEEMAPYNWAATQRDLGNAYWALARDEDTRANLQRAITTYEAVLSIYTPETAPLDYATTQHHLGIAQRDLGNLDQAIACWRESERYYRQMGVVEDADLMLQWIARAEGGEA